MWGRLDELQPTDVINPIDVSRFFFEGRSEARLPVPLVRARVFAGDKASIEGIYVPFFRRGRFDRLDEALIAVRPDAAGTVPRILSPARTAGNGQGGARVNVTTGRVDWSVSAYRGFRPFGVYTSSFRLTSLRQGYGGPPKRYARRRKAEATEWCADLSAVHDGGRRLRNGRRAVGGSR